MNETYMCKKCDLIFDYNQEDAFWKEFSTYSVKLIRCPKCGCLNTVRIIEDESLQVNFDEKYYI